MSRFVLLAGAVMSITISPLFGQQGPVPVSPGSLGEDPAVVAACPTFHWAQTEGAAGYELAVHQVQGSEAPKSRSDLAGALALREMLPPGVGSWTPSLDRCLEPGGRYVWTVRLVNEKSFGMPPFGDWSEARHFLVREQSRLERILGRVVQRLVEEGELTEEDAEQLVVWGLAGSAGGPPGEPLVEGTWPRGAPVGRAEVAARSAREVAQPEPQQLAGSVDAVFQVDGTGHERGVFAVGKFGVWGESDSTVGARGVYGRTTAGSGGGRGVQGRSDSAEGVGVFGWAPASAGTTLGVSGESDSIAGTGVFGWAPAATGSTFGVSGQSDSIAGTGVLGSVSTATGVTHGVRGESQSTNGIGVYGRARSLSGVAYGVQGDTASISGTGVFGRAEASSGTSYGVYGVSDSVSGFDFYAGGAGTDYGPFTGGHEVRLVDGFGEVLAGMVVSVTGKAQVREESGAIDLSSTLPTVTLSTGANDSAVFGVLVAESTLGDDHWYQASEGERFATVNALGEGRVWITDANGPVQAGDYLTTSDVPGYAQRQGDDHLRAFTLGKIIETIDWAEVSETVEHRGRRYRKALLAVVYTSG